MLVAKIRFLSPYCVIPLNTLLACAKIVASGCVARVAKGHLLKTAYTHYFKEVLIKLSFLVQK